MKDLRLSEIYIYPIKSLGGIQLSSAKVMEKGLLHDRRWMLIDEFGGFMTQRIYTQMALFQVSIDTDQITVVRRQASVSDKSTITFGINKPPMGETFRSKVWDDEVDVVEVDEKLSRWFSNHFDMRCKLVSFPERHSRPVDPKHQINNEQVSLADAYPFLIIGQSSLDDLNSRLKDPLPINRFRPNFVFTGGDPYEEDQWGEIKIGGNRFVGVKNCARCVLTTVNQDTGEKGVEPLLTLSTYRKRDNKIYYGQNLIARDHTKVSVGDIITLN